MVWVDVENGPLLYKLNLIATGLSLLGSIAMIYFGFKTKVKSIALKLILAIALSDFLYSIANLMTAFEDDYNGLLCHADAVLREFSFTFSIFWVTCTAILCYKTSKTWRFDQELFFKKAFVIGALFCLVLISL